MKMLPSMLTAVLFYVTLLTYTSATSEGAAETADAQPQHDQYNDLQQALFDRYMARVHKNAAMRARRVQAAKRPADLFPARSQQKAALRPGKFYRGDAPEKRMYDYGLDYDSFIPPEKRSANRH